MAKNTRAQEVSTGTSDSYTEDEIQDPTPPMQVLVTRPMLGEVDKPAKEEEPSPVTEDGGDSTQSSESEQIESDKPNPSPQQPAPMTENLSSQTDQSVADSDADSTDGDGPKTEPQPSAKKATPAKKTTGRPARARTMAGAEDDFDEFS